MLLPGDEVRLVVKVVPTNGTATGVGGYVTFYVPNGVTVTDTAYVIPDGAGDFTAIPMAFGSYPGGTLVQQQR